MDCPYTYPHETREAMAEYLTRNGRGYDYRRYRFAWNVKTHGARFDSAALRNLDPGLDPAFDLSWETVIAKDDGTLFWMFCEDAARYVADGEWTSYRGDDQGDWQFAFAGRSGGWLVLEKWRGRRMIDIDPADFLDPDEWSDEELTAFYMGIRCADQDFTPKNAAREVEYQAATYRSRLEDDWRAEREAAAQAFADELTEARPDMYSPAE